MRAMGRRQWLAMAGMADNGGGDGGQWRKLAAMAEVSGDGRNSRSERRWRK